MRKEILLFSLIVFSFLTKAQQNLSGGRKNSNYTYIYQVNERETSILYRSGMHKFSEQYFHTLIDSFLTNTGAKPSLKNGNYLFMLAAGNRIQGELITIDDLQYKRLDINRDLIIALHTKTGQVISDADVYINKRKISFDEHLQAFRQNKRKNNGTIRIRHNGVAHLFSISEKKGNYRKSFIAKISNSFPLKYIVQPIKRWINNRESYYNYFTTKARYERNFTGFMVFNKPIYKPGDTVKLKASILTKNGNPVNRPLLLRLTAEGFGIDTIIGVIKPYRPGAFEYQFATNVSLDLTLDEQYLLTLEELNSRKYNLEDYVGNLDEDEYALKRKILLRGKFEYEEYELSSVTFSARTDKQEHNRNNPVSVYLKATDENGLAVMDGRVEIILRLPNNNTTSFHEPKVFLPDTLWSFSQKLDPVGETKIIVPDSIFPAASFNYQIECIFLNSNNELKTQTLFQFYDYTIHKIFVEQKNDSLYIKQLKGYKTDTVPAMIVAFRKEEDTISFQNLQLPATVAISPFATYYEIKTDTSYEEYTINKNRNMISCVALRTADSVIIQAINPNKLFFWYTLFAGNKVIERGYTNQLYFKERSRTRKNYFISLQYIYNNKSYTENYTAAYQDKLLTIETDQPAYVYPGQKTAITVSVTNASGDPVADADITSYAVTKKFEKNQPPFIPYLGKLYPGRKRFSSFYESTKELLSDIQLNWKRWSHEMGLDSMEYYKFLYTPAIYRNEEPAKDSITQIAPFVVLDGTILPVRQLYIDEVPVFFNQAQQLSRYSFRVQPGKHSLRLRTDHLLLKIDSVWATAGCKTFFSFKADTFYNKMLRIEKMPDTLTTYEKKLWSKYMILIENNFGEKFSYIKQGEQVSLLNYPLIENNSTQKLILTGPFSTYNSTLKVKNNFEQVFEPEGNYVFDIRKGLIKQKQVPGNRLSFNSNLSNSQINYNFNDYVLTEKEIDSLWEEYLDRRSANKNLFRNYEFNKKNNGRLLIETKNTTKKDSLFSKNIFLLRYDDVDYLRIYKGVSRDLGYVQPGVYRLLILFKGDRYFIKDSIRIREYGTNYYLIENIAILPKDTLSARIATVINDRDQSNFYNNQENDQTTIRELFNEKYLEASLLTRTVHGRVMDSKDGTGLSYVSVKLKGTTIGTVTNAQGYFHLNVTPKATIVVTGIGYNFLEQRLGEEDYYEFRIQPSTTNLSEVVVTAYGLARSKKEVGYSIATVTNGMDALLMGKVSGVNIIIRGSSSMGGEPKQLIFVDGLPHSGDISKLDTSAIKDIKILKGAEAIAIYGAEAANGVIIITTRKNNIDNGLMNEHNDPIPGISIRKNFRDDAFWQPRLRTNADGKITFQVSFPDDITNWRSFYIAMNGKQTGFLEQTIKSFKSLSANLAVPLFLISGDSATVIGKTLSYSLDSVTIDRSFGINKTNILQTPIQFKNAWIDTFMIAAGATDSLLLSYTIQKPDGYFDGEERTIPVFEQGILETSGIFEVLENDTTFTYQPKDKNHPVKLYAEASLLPVLLDEIESIRTYEYLCNEQLASKLKALLLKKKVYNYLKKKFNEEKNIIEILKKLNQGKGQTGLWGWWNNNEAALWISFHAVEGLLLAEQGGYQINLNKAQLVDYLVFNVEQYSGVEKIFCLQLLQLLKAKIDFRKYMEGEEKRIINRSFTEKLRLIQLKQQLGLPVSLDTLVRKANSTLFGNLYWGEDNYQFFDNSIQNTVLMYKLMRSVGGYELMLKKVCNYFLEKRKNGNWRNTYESILILETILPDLLKNDSLPQASSIQINSGETIRSFPYSIKLNAGEKVSVQKNGSLPVYFTAYQQNWNPAPLKEVGNFTVKSVFEVNEETKTILNAGEPVELKVVITAKADADFVMIEIPIPAGCSYHSKKQFYVNNEVHREYFKNKASIFCNSLNKGTYTFTISLVPRFTGRYHLNPAKAELMYFPVFYGREEMKKITIK